VGYERGAFRRGEDVGEEEGEEGRVRF
jgi:hypothetical protein